jgi:hypothetical protein
MTRVFSTFAKWVTSVALFSAAVAHADVLDSTLTSLGANQWRYDYTINNPTDVYFDELTVYFDVANYGQLEAPIAPGSWDAVLVQPDAGIPANGYVDFWNPFDVMTPGSSESGFSVTFNFLGTGSPGAQSFDLIDSTTFAVVYSGTTTVVDSTIPVPESSSLSLVILGLAIGVLKFRLQKQASTPPEDHSATD